jgi:hypothetical protein
VIVTEPDSKPIGPKPPNERQCIQCRNHRRPPDPTLFSQTDLQTPGGIKAYREWEQTRAERAQQEQQMLRDGTPFLHKPHSRMWCAAYTELELVERARRGDEEAREAALDKGVARLSPVTGEVIAVYAICDVKNPEGRCPRYAPR